MKYISFIMIFSSLILSCENPSLSRTRYYQYRLNCTGNDFGIFDYYKILNASTIATGEAQIYYAVTTLSNGKISTVKCYANPTIEIDPGISGGAKTNESLRFKPEDPKSLSYWIKYNYDTNGDLESINYTWGKTTINRIDRYNAQYEIYYTEEKKVLVTGKIINDSDGNIIFIEKNERTGLKIDTSIIYLNNKIIVSRHYSSGDHEVFEFTFQNNEIAKVKYSNNKGLAWVEDESNGFKKNQIK
jgi:hypothetical protein